MKPPRTRATTQTRLAIASALVDASSEMRQACAALPGQIHGTIHTSLHEEGAVRLTLPWPDVELLKSPLAVALGPQLRHIAVWPEQGTGQLVLDSHPDRGMVFETHTFTRPLRYPTQSWRTQKLTRILADHQLRDIVGVGCTGDGDTVMVHVSAPADSFIHATAALIGADYARALLRLCKIAGAQEVTGQVRVGSEVEIRVQLENIKWEPLLSVCSTCEVLVPDSFSALGHFAGAMGASQADTLEVMISKKSMTLSVGVEFDG